MLGLGLGLNRGGASSEGLALELQFATDLTLTARKGPTPSFTRGTSATEVGPDKLIRYAPENLLARSQDQSIITSWPALNSATRNANSSIGVDGTMSATAVIFSIDPLSLIFSNFNQPSPLNATLTFSIWVSSSTGKKFRLAIFSGGSQLYSNNITPTATLARYEFTFVNATSNSINACIVNESAGGVGEIVIWGAQLERHTSARTYIPTTTGAVYGPRFDHDPITGQCKGLLIEEPRSNLLLQSNGFTSGSWSFGGGTFSSATQVAPDGGANSFLFTEDTSVGPHRIFQAFTGTIGTTYTSSVFLKFAGRPQVFVETRSITGNPYAVFNLQTGVVDVVSGGITASMEQFPNGWWRCRIIGTADMAGGNTLFGGFSGGSASYMGSGSAAFYIFGAQVEAGAFPTSYIPTAATVPVVRSADVCSITGTDFSGFYNQSEGTLFLNAVPPFESQLAYPLMVNTTGNSQAHRIGRSNEFGAGSKRWIALTTTNAGLEAVITTSGNITTTNVKAAYAFKLNDNAFAVNNVLVGTDTTVTMPNPTSMRIGGNDGVNVMNGHIAAVRFYKKRLPDAKLQVLTV